MKGIGGRQAETYETVLTIDGAGTAFTAGDTITFTKAFDNIPCAMVVCVLGTVNLNNQPAGVWTVTCTRTEAVITVESALPSEFRSSEIHVGIIVQEQL